MMDAVEAVADAWASIDGKLDEFRAGKGKPILEQPGGYHAGYIFEAEEMIERLKTRGFVVVPKAALDDIAAGERTMYLDIYREGTDGSDDLDATVILSMLTLTYTTNAANDD